MTNHTSSSPLARASAWNERYRADEQLYARVLLRVVDGGLAGSILIVPWCMGGRHPVGELVLVLAALAASLAWIARQRLVTGCLTWTRSPADAIFPAAVALVLLQLAPLPAAVLDVLSPHTRDLLPLWISGGQSVGLGVWNQVTMTPAATQSALVVLIAYGLLFFTAVQRIEKLEDVERILRWVALSVTLTALFGLVQYLTSNGKFLWIYRHPYRFSNVAATGMYINKNHFAHLLALGVGPLVWCLARALQQPRSELERLGQQARRWRMTLHAFALAIVMFAGLMSLSRGGIAMIALAAITCGAALYRAGLLDRTFVVSTVAAVLLVLCSLAIHGHREVVDRLDDYASGSLAQLDRDGGRRAIWRADAVALKDYFVFGSGVGSHREIHPTYLAEPFDTEFTHAENGYLQIALETGIPGLAILATSLGYIAAWCFASLRAARSPRLFACAAAVAASLLVSAVHSLVDFVWYIPSCMATAVLLAACALRLWHLNQLNPRRRQALRGALSARLALVACAGIVLGGAWMVRDRFCAAVAAPHWDAYLEFALSQSAQAGAIQPSLEVIDHLNAVVRWTPRDDRAQLALAEACMQRFEQLQADSANAMPLGQIRDAALASRFASRSALDEWLARAVGDNRRLLDAALWHTRRALVNCPLAGRAYIDLAQLCFLSASDDSMRPALMDQALRVRPYDGSVLLCAGSEAALANDPLKALDYWRRALRAGPKSQRQLVDLWAATQVPVEVILREFRPGLAAVRLMDARYSQLDRPDELQRLLAYYAQVAQQEAREATGAEAAQLCLELHGVYRRLGNPAEELQVLRQALALVPNDYQVRYALATALCRQRQLGEAEQHLRWCIERQGQDEQLRELLAAAVKHRINSQRVSASHDTDLKR
jgi:O-antigen ligase